MSFSTEVKEELSVQLNTARHCRIAELAALVSVIGKASVDEFNNYELVLQTDNIAIGRKTFNLLKETFGICAGVSVKSNPKMHRGISCRLIIDNSKEVLKVLKALKLIAEDGSIIIREDYVNDMLISSSCCRRAFVRGLFLTSGSVTDPNKPYHFEIVCQSAEKAEQLREVIASFDIEARVVERKSHSVVYIKGGDLISDMLNIMEAHTALFNLENVRIKKELRGMVNRVNNCDNANINKIVSAAVEQSNYIRYIYEKKEFNSLPDSLRELAELRLEFPEASIKELGMKLNPPLGKSGVNHRLNKLKDIANSLRENEEREK